MGPRGFDLLDFRNVPLDGTGDAARNGGTKVHARASKITVASETPYAGGKISTFIAGDFLGRVDTGARTDDDTATNSYEFRIRQAYVKWGNFLAGQAWSNFVDLKAYPEGLTYTSVLGRGFVRQAQLRYTLPIANGDYVSVSLENPDTDFNLGTPAPGDNADEDDSVPDVIATYFNKIGRAHIRASLLLRSLGVDTSSTVDELSEAQSDTAFGWGLGFSSKFYLQDNFNVKVNMHGGSGIGRYMLANPFRAATFIDGELETETAWGGNVFAQYLFNEKLRMNIGYGFLEVDVDESLVSGSVNRKLTSFHTNIIWRVASGLEVGTGFTHATREVVNGTEGDLTRFMFTVKRKFFATF